MTVNVLRGRYRRPYTASDRADRTPRPGQVTSNDPAEPCGLAPERGGVQPRLYVGRTGHRTGGLNTPLRAGHGVEHERRGVRDSKCP